MLSASMQVFKCRSLQLIEVCTHTEEEEDASEWHFTHFCCTRRVSL